MAILSGFAVRGGAFIIGMALHVFLFRVGEWDLQTTRLIVTSVVAYIAAIVGTHRFLAQEYESLPYAIKDVSVIALCVTAGIFISLLTYRLLFHRLNKFPGPLVARLSNIYPTYLSTKKFHLYEEVQALHQQYGDYVRLGPSELSICDPMAVAAIHSAQSQCTKGPWYNALHPMVSLHVIRNKPEHIRRRKVWDRGFSSKALRDYEPRVIKYADQLLVQLDARVGQPINITDWFNFYSFDVMGDLAWGKSFNMVQSGVKHYFMSSLHKFMLDIGTFSHLMWLLPIFKSTPILNSESVQFWNWINEQVSDRRNMKPDRPDVFSWLLAEHESNAKPTVQEELNLVGDAYTIAVAGSDTTAAVLTCLFYQLAVVPKSLSALQQEIDDAFNTIDVIDSTALSKLPYLDAVVNETLRLHPPIPSGFQRMTPPEGLQVGEKFIPGESIVQIPLHTLYRDERFFVDPDVFVPERWSSKKEMTKDASIFAPFSTGRYSCIGKQLGLMEVRHVAAQIVRKYDVELAPGQTPQAFLDGKKDAFTLALGPLQLVFRAREKHGGT